MEGGTFHDFSCVEQVSDGNGFAIHVAVVVVMVAVVVVSFVFVVVDIAFVIVVEAAHVCELVHDDLISLGCGCEARTTTSVTDVCVDCFCDPDCICPHGSHV